MQNDLSSPNVRLQTMRNLLVMVAATGAFVALAALVVAPAGATPGHGGGGAGGRPTDGAVGNADDKTPPGQGSKPGEAGFTCDDNKGVGQGNPAHTGCSSTSPSATSTSTGSPSPTPTATGSPSPTATATGSPSPTPTATGSPSPTPTATDSPSPTPTSTSTPSGTPTGSPTHTATEAPTGAPTTGTDGGGGGGLDESPDPAGSPIGNVSSPQAGQSSPTPARTSAPGGTPTQAALPSVLQPTQAQQQPTTRPRSLPFTGSGTDMLLRLGGGLSMVGLVLALIGRRRRTAA